ncbi:hypothetical protein SAMN05421774_1233 [Gemmobacter megaterium]|uniref:Lipoprotein n=1 Tax=Gemmobacter megaterium TaxID=1086013 RepID=A0A1N7QRR8_9RHOB|nr:hypothetical protein [Gemmobacter megaterium]GGE29107.1 hypothetical protein GCM10011345_38980 [Gemmobacter megaterium]SIT25498.1 hypothetical protein SAMN05421774_1233 [Gemmobacter megaterium]
MARSILFPLLAVMLSACFPAGEPAEAKMGTGPAETARVQELARTPDSLRAFLSGTTVKQAAAGGTRIEHLASDGSSHLWQSGQTAIVPGRWSVRQATGGAQVCIQRTGQGPDCAPANDYLLGLGEIVDGDPLRLSQGLPFILPEGGDLSISFAMMKAGFGPLQTPNKAIAPRYPDLG